MLLIGLFLQINNEQEKQGYSNNSIFSIRTIAYTVEQYSKRLPNNNFNQGNPTNADDAGATKVSFFLDFNSYKTVKTIYENMKVVQGPALLSYNNAIFKEKDYKSLSKLGDSEKKEEEGTTGRFGIGFNSIYHLTDYPHIISGDRLTFLDPLTTIKPDKPNEPGFQIIISEKKLEALEKCTDQFEPYSHLDYKLSEFYNGTIFRYPLRQKPSKISDLCWTPTQVLEQFQNFLDDGINQILFLQNVRDVSFYTIEKEKENKKEKVLVGRVSIENGNNGLFTSFVNGKEEKLQWIKFSKKIEKPKEFQVKEMPYQPKCDIAYCFDKNIQGTCYTTLPVVATGFPVHFNGWFELMSNRKSIWVKESQKLECIKWNWNSLLMTIISDIYVDLIMHLQSIGKDVYPVFPSLTVINKEWIQLFVSIYMKLAVKPIIQCLASQKKCTINEGYLFKLPMENKNLCKILDELGIPTFEIPPHVLSGFECTGVKLNIIATTDDLKNVCVQRNINIIETLSLKSIGILLDAFLALGTSNDLKVMKDILKSYLDHQKLGNAQNIKHNHIVLFILSLIEQSKINEYEIKFLVPAGNLKGEFSSYRKIDSLLDHENEDFKLLFQKESLYCLSEFHRYKNVMISKFNMKKTITPEIFSEKVETADPENLMLVLNRNDEVIKKGNLEWKKMMENVKRKIIPVMKQIEGFPVPFYDNKNDYALPGEVYSNYRLVGSICPVFRDKYKSDVEKLLSLHKKPSIGQVVQQLRILSKYNVTHQSWVEEIYQYIEKCLKENSKSSQIVNEKIVLIDGEFVEPNRIFKSSHVSWKPLMYQLPSYLSKFENFLSKILKIGDLTVDHIRKAIVDIPNTNLPFETQCSIMLSMMKYLMSKNELKFENQDNLKIPTLNEKFEPISTVVYVDDKSHYEKLKSQLEESYSILHQDFLPFANRLKIQKFSNLISEKYSKVLEFEGQHESLCQRIKNILEDNYTFGFPIFHEMIQNADDSKASYLRIVLDKRTWNSELLLHPKLESTQGPSLYFINDKPFIEKDFVNIQKLGMKNKLDNVGTTGQFGIGFNSVYHISDCPMILSSENLVILDPQEKYIEEKGRRFVVNRFLRNNCKDSFIPFENVRNEVSFNNNEIFPGTIIRLPMRTKASSIWETVHSIDEIDDLLTKLPKPETKSSKIKKDLTISQLQQCILFTKYLKKISIEVIDTNDNKKVYCECTKTNDQQIDTSIQTLNTVEHLIKEGKDYVGLKSSGYVNIEMKDMKDMKNTKTRSEFLVSYCINDTNEAKELLKESKKKENAGRYIPFAAIAIQMSKHEIVLNQGVLFNTLPIEKFKQNFYVNSSFCLKRSRKSMDDVENNQSFRYRWQAFLFYDVIIDSLLELLKILRVESGSNEIKNYHELFPVDFENSNVGSNFLKKIGDDPIFYAKSGDYISAKILFENYLQEYFTNL